jgi:hypothetical protein
MLTDPRFHRPSNPHVRGARWVLLSGIVLLSACNADRIARLEKQNKELAAKLEAVSKKTNLDLQERCAKQSHTQFLADGNEQDLFTGYTNHYNAKLDKCFMEVTSSAGSGTGKTYVPSIYRTVYDAYEGKVYAQYYWRNATGKKLWEVPPMDCKVTSLTGDEKVCQTTEEYETLIKQYMEQ